MKQSTVSYLSIALCSVYLIGVVLLNERCAAEQLLAEPNSVDVESEGVYDELDEEKRGGGRAFAQHMEKKGGGRAFSLSNKRGGGRTFGFYGNSMEKRGGARSFYGGGGMSGYYGYPYASSYPLIYEKKALSSDYMPYYLQQQFKRAGGRAFLQNDVQLQPDFKRAGARPFVGEPAF